MKQLSDEQLDKLIRNLVNSVAADEATVNQIVDSPATWWGVQRRINEQNCAKVSPWPPLGKMLRWLMIGAPVAAAVALILSFFIFRQAPSDDKGSVALVSPVSSVTQTVPETVAPSDEPLPSDTKISNKVVDDETRSVKATSKQPVHKDTGKSRKVEPKNLFKTEVAKMTEKEEIKTEFIALSYARDPDSGQIVRVKVPSSMMVSLGLVTSVKAPSDMVDAEVLVGDDGLSRAIRFIR